MPLHAMLLHAKVACVMHYKGDLIFFKAIDGNVSPGIIVQGGVYGITINHREAEFKKGTEDSAKKGYGILMVS
jgi:hypothetical protein